MNILVTGGTGYLGARISCDLSKKNKTFIQSRNKKNSILESKNIIQFRYDWKNHYILNEYLKKIDVIIHTAGADFNFCEKNKKEAEKCYLTNTEILYFYAKKNNVKKIINFSTTQVYGSQKGQIHEDSSLDLNSNYAFLNYEREKLSEKLKKSNVTFLNLRLSNCFGFPILKKTNCWKLVLPNICKNIILTNHARLKTKDDFYKNFSTIDDLSNLIKLLINSKKKLPILLNFSSGKPKKISQLVKIILNTQKKIYGKEAFNNLDKLKFIKKPDRNIISNHLNKIDFKFSNNYTYEVLHLLKATKKFFNQKSLK
jgi:nucleoside-diphosphate-sugar epimerase